MPEKQVQVYIYILESALFLDFKVTPPKLFRLQSPSFFPKFVECLIKLPIDFAGLFEEQPQVTKRLFRVFLRDKGFLACHIVLHHALCTVEVDGAAEGHGNDVVPVGASQQTVESDAAQLFLYAAIYFGQAGGICRIGKRHVQL